MLILTRRVGETIVIGDNISVTILEINPNNRNQIRLGIDAPRQIEVHRLEIYNRIKQEQADQAEKEENNENQS